MNGPVATAGSTPIRLKNIGTTVPMVAARIMLAQIAKPTAVGNFHINSAAPVSL